METGPGRPDAPNMMRTPRTLPFILVVFVVGLLAGVAAASSSLRRSPTAVLSTSATGVLHGSQQEGTDQGGEQEGTEQEGTEQDQERPGQEGEGTVRRFHDQGLCVFPEGVTVPDGNWTHGDYVSAWAATGDPGAATTAAHSPCGKPLQALHQGIGSSSSLPGAVTHGKSGQPHGRGAGHGRAGGGS
jgi:hypothetical protein